LKIRPLFIYGSERIPEGVVPSTSVSSCIAKAIFTLAWFPPDHLSLAIPIIMARRMSEDLKSSFITKRPAVAYPEHRASV
jgi:hypothetical protein